MAHLHKKIKKGKAYYYVREMARVNGKPKVVSQVYLGTAEKILALASEKPPTASLEILKVQEFGALWLADLIDKSVGLTELVDDIVPKNSRETGPSVGEYFFYAVLNRMVDATSKRALPQWYEGTAVQAIRPVDINALDSDGYWRKWERVTEEHIKKIAKAFFRKLAELYPSQSSFFLFDTTNYFTFMAGKTASDLAKRGKNKQGRDWLRQIGLALLVDKQSRLPLFYDVYPGNQHDSKVFRAFLAEIIGAMHQNGGEDVTIVIDKGMNSCDNFSIIDEAPGVHFITTYSPYFAEDLALTKRELFTPLQTTGNKQLREKGKIDDLVLAWRSKGIFWGAMREVVVTYNPVTASKQRYIFDEKLTKLQTELFEMRSRIKEAARGWKSEAAIRNRYVKICEKMHLPCDLYELSFETKSGSLSLSFRKNHYRIGKHIEKFGKNILISDRSDWSTEEIVQAGLDRYIVEESFRLSKDDQLVGVSPIRHWTDGKIACHFLCCIMALAYIRLIELKLKQAGLQMTGAQCMKQMRRLHSCLCQNTGEKPSRIIEEPTQEQAVILKTFGHEVKRGVLQKTSS
jgi:transposase